MSDNTEIQLLKHAPQAPTPEEVINGLLETLNSVIAQQNVLFEKIVEMSGHIQGLGEHVTFLLLKDPDYMQAFEQNQKEVANEQEPKTTTVE